MIRNQNADPARTQPRDNLLYIIYRNRVDSRKRLVEQNIFRLDSQHPGDLRPATLAARQRVPFILPDVTKPELFDQLFHPVVALGASHRQRFEYGQNVLLNSEFAKDRSFLGKIADSETRAFVEGQFCNTLFAEPNTAFIRLFQPHYHVKRRGLSRSVWAEQSDDLAGTNFDGNIVDDTAAAIGLPQTISPQSRAVRLRSFIETVELGSSDLTIKKLAYHHCRSSRLGRLDRPGRARRVIGCDFSRLVLPAPFQETPPSTSLSSLSH